MNEILNFHQVSDRIATSGQPTADQFPKIHEAGYTVIVNLAMTDAMNLRVSAFMYQYLKLKEGRSAEQASSPHLLTWSPKMDARWRAIIELQAHEIPAINNTPRDPGLTPIF